MTVPRHAVEEAFLLVLGRLPGPENPLHYDSAEDLWSALIRSPEARARPSGKRRMPWPLGQVFVSRRARVVYNPIGKNACTFLKQQIARAENPPGLDLLMVNIHSTTDRLKTGLQFSDHPPDAVEEFMASPDYLRVAMLRDPAERLLSAYVEKLVLGRDVLANIHHTRSIVEPVQRRQGLERPDYARGITFRDFVTEIVSGPPERLDPHWIPQALYLKGMRWSWFYALEDIERMIRMIERRSGRTLPRLPANQTGSGRGERVPDAADLLPADLLARPRADRDSFFDADLSRMVAEYFIDDYALLARARRG